jgi:hypothetical protein
MHKTTSKLAPNSSKFHVNEPSFFLSLAIIEDLGFSFILATKIETLNCLCVTILI